MLLHLFKYLRNEIYKFVQTKDKIKMKFPGILLMVLLPVLSFSQQVKFIYYSDVAWIEFSNNNTKFSEGYKIFYIEKNKCFSYAAKNRYAPPSIKNEIIRVNKNKKQYSYLFNNNIVQWQPYCNDTDSFTIEYVDSSKTILTMPCKLAYIHFKNGETTKVWYTESMNYDWIFPSVFCKIPGTVIRATGKKTKILEFREMIGRSKLINFKKYYNKS